MPRASRVCKINKCPEIAKKQGFCQHHYNTIVKPRQSGKTSGTKYPSWWKKISQEYLAYNKTCVKCGAKSQVVHHIVERKQGGQDIPENFLALCKSCHSRLHKAKK